MHACPGAQLWLQKQQGKSLLKSFQEAMKVAVEGSRRTPCFCKGRAGKTHEWRIVALLCVKTRREGRSAMRYCSLHWLSYLLFCLWQNEGLKHSKQNLCIWHFPSLLTALPSGYCAIQTHHSLWITKWLPPVRFCHLFHFCVRHLCISIWIIFFLYGESPFIFLIYVRIRMNICAGWVFSDILWRSLPRSSLLEYSCLI